MPVLGDGEVHRCAFADLALHPNLSALRENGEAAKRQTEAGAAGCALHLREGLKNHLGVLGGDAVPFIGDRKPDRTVAHPRPQENVAAFWAELQRVAEKIDNDSAGKDRI